jgi:hypothetical protein
MTCRLLNVLTALSLLLCAAVVAVQVRAYVAGKSRVVLRETVDAVYVAEIDPKYIMFMSTAHGMNSTGDTRILVELPLRVLTVLSGALPVLWLSRWFRHLSERAGICPNCGYDLTGIADGVCPECQGAGTVAK